MNRPVHDARGRDSVAALRAVQRQSRRLFDRPASLRNRFTQSQIPVYTVLYNVQ